jgi:hypothetical protein
VALLRERVLRLGKARWEHPRHCVSAAGSSATSAALGSSPALAAPSARITTECMLSYSSSSCAIGQASAHAVPQINPPARLQLDTGPVS